MGASGDVAARLDELGWLREHTSVYDQIGRLVLFKYADGREPPRWVIVDLDDGHRVGEFGTDQAGWTAFTVFTGRADQG